MSFGGGGGGGFGGGFGSNNTNNNQNNSTFGGFGNANNNNTSTPAFGFGSNNNSNNNTGGSLFGNNNNNNNSGGFGVSGGAFGSNNTNTASAFGGNNKPGFGASTAATGGLFGNNSNTSTVTSGFGGFGNTSNTNNNTSSPFGGGNNTTGGGLFGNNANKTGFGATTTGSSLFGGGNTNTATNNTAFGGGAFGVANTSASGDPPGTAATPFQAFTEKEANSTSTNSFQNILFQEPYKKWSADELRLTDYAQGRRHGNASGAGAFGMSSGFGNTGTFGSNTNNQTSTGFGAASNTNNSVGGGLFGAGNNNTNTNNNTATGFGSSTFGNNNNSNSQSGGLFGQNKPATGGLFGGSPATATTGGGLFGANTGGFGANAANNNTSTAFGANNANSGGLFGANNQQKPTGTGFSFGNAATNTNTNTGFGGTSNNTGGGLFGNTNNNQTQPTTGGLFGNTNNQQATAGGFGGGAGFGQQNQAQNTAGGLFGNTQSKPAGGLFGAPATNTGTPAGGLFGGGNNQAQQTPSAFGNSQQNAAGGGLFGNKPASNGLFGNNTTAQANPPSGGLFGGLNQNNQTQQQAGGGLFGQSNSTNSQQQQKSSLFGASQPASGGLFGSQNNQNSGSGLFGNSMGSQQQNNNMQSSLLGNSPQNNAPPFLSTSLNDITAYGSPSLFAGVGEAGTPNPGPLATPLGSGTQKSRRSAVLPMYRLAPTSGTRYSTPSKRGYGFAYSTYGTPGASPASSISSTPSGGSALGRSILGSSSTGSLSKSVSVNNLRRTYGAEDSILAPGAFSNSNRWYGSTGSRKLVINRDIRSDIFSTPQKEKPADANASARKLSKRVSFDTSNVDSEEGTPVRGALPAVEDAARSLETEETPRQNRSSTGSNDADRLHTSDQSVQRSDDTVTPEVTRSPAFTEVEAGDYWMSPTLEDLKSRNRMQRSKVDNFTVGRENVGQIEFKVPVDLSNTNLDDIIDSIVQLSPRSATVYPDSAKKPPMGKGLNVPARISLDQSWSRNSRDRSIATDPKRIQKHVDRLKSMPDTTFENYDHKSGVWVFTVEHFTTYGFDEEDEESEMEISTHPLDTQETEEDGETAVTMQDDTFDFRHGRGLPGSFERHIGSNANTYSGGELSFLGDSSADPAPNHVKLSLVDDEDADVGDGYDLSDEENFARSSFEQHHAAELENTSPDHVQEARPSTPGGILRARMRAMKESVGPYELEIADGDDWTEMLRKSVSPAKRDRQLLRENNGDITENGRLIDFDQDDNIEQGSTWRRSVVSKQINNEKGQGFATSIDLMNSLFDKPKPVRGMHTSVPAKGFPKFPVQRADRGVSMDSTEQAFRDAARPAWGPNESLLLTKAVNPLNAKRSLRNKSELITFHRSYVKTETQELCLNKFSPMSARKYLEAQEKLTDIILTDGVPLATLRRVGIREMYYSENASDPGRLHEKRVWQLASILFDETDESDILARKQRLSDFWVKLVESVSNTTISMAASGEEKAVACLAGHRIIDACKYLLEGKNFHLGTLVPMIGSSDAAKKNVKEQLKAWHASNTLAEFSEPVRTIYELLSGNVCVCEGNKAADIENRMESFVISRKFGLDWKQSFGLRLWYATSQGDDLSEAVRKFEHDLRQDKEDSPKPWYVEQGIPSLWTDEKRSTHQDLLWGLLELYTYSDTDLEAVLRPENSQLTPLDMRLTWQLGLALTSTGKVSFGHNAAEKADACTLAFSAQLSSAGEWLEAVFVLLHLSDSAARRSAIQEHLSRHAAQIDEAAFSVLNEKFKIPEPWIWEAKALLMRSLNNYPAEVHCLLRAGSFIEAHLVLVIHVAPLAIIERDYGQLGDIISQLEGRQDAIDGWHLGGEIYGNFLKLVNHKNKGEETSAGVLERLLVGLRAMSEKMSGKNVLQFAAISDMADETAREILRSSRRRRDAEFNARILDLPLTQDRLLTYSVGLGMVQYREMMPQQS